MKEIPMAVAGQPARRRRRRSRGRRLGWVLALAVLVVAAALFYWFYWRPRGAGESAQATGGPEIVTVFPQAYRVGVAGPGTLAAARSLDVAARVSGTVVTVALLGQRLEGGEVIARLDPVPFQRAVSDAELALQKAEVQVASLRIGQADSSASLQESIANAQRTVDDARRERDVAASALELTQQLFLAGSESAEGLRDARDANDRAQASLQSAEENLATLQQSLALRQEGDAQELRSAELAVKQAELSLERAQEDLEATTVRAPFTGVVAGVTASEGGLVGSNGPLVTLMDDRRLELEVQIDETDIGRIATGMSADVTLDAFEDRVFAGTVTVIAPAARIVQNIPIFDVTVSLDNPELRLRPGMTAEAEIVVQEVARTVSVPSRAVSSVRGRSYIQVEQSDGSFGAQRVEVIDTVGFNTIVAAELAPGSRVLVPEAAAGGNGANTRGNGGGNAPRIPFVPGGGPGGRGNQ